MRYSNAIDLAIREIQANSNPSGDAVQAALRLAIHARDVCHCRGRGAPAWALFGSNLMAVYAALHADGPPLTITTDEQQLFDTPHTRRETVRLTNALAAQLLAASSDPNAPPDQRWQWATAAADLEAAAACLAALQ